MLFKFPKYSQIIYSTILFILILNINFSDLTLTNNETIVDEQFANLCKEMSEDLESKIAEVPATILNYPADRRDSQKDNFDNYIVKKIDFLAASLNKINQNIKEKDTFFYHSVSKFVKTVEKAKKDAEKVKKDAERNHGSLLERILANNPYLLEEAKKDIDLYPSEEVKKDSAGIHCLILDKILYKNPQQFFAILDQLLWKIEDKKLKKVEQKNGGILMKYTEDEDGANHSRGNMLSFPNEYITLRKTFNKFINKLKIEIRYIRSIVAIEARMAMTPSMRILDRKYYKYKSPMVTSKSEFNIFIVNKIKFLADELKRIKKNTNVKESLFDDAINKFVKIIEEAKKDADGNHDLILDRIFGKNPHQFFAIMDQFLWKIDDKKLEKIEQKNGEILMKYTEIGNVSNHSNNENIFMVPDEYINLRKIINKFINRLKIEIVYGQSFGAILEIEENSKYKQIFKINFDEMENEAKNFVHKKEGKIRKLKKEIREEGSKKLEEKFMKLAKRKMKDIPNKYNELYLYNLLNNAIIDLQKMLVELVAEIVDGKQNGIHGNLVLVELIVKPMLREVFDEATTMPDTPETRNFVEEIVGKDKIRTICLRSIKGSSSIYNRISEKFKGKDENEIPVEFFKFDYNLVEMIKQNLGLPSDFLKIENFIVANTTKKEEKRMAVRKSKIRIAAAKLILVYERLKAMFYEEEELNENEKKNAQEITELLSQIYMQPIPAKRFGELLYKYIFENFQNV